MKEFGLEIEGVSQAVGGIDAHDQRAVVELGKFYAGGRGQAGLADAALAAEEENPHIFIIVMARSYEGILCQKR